MTVNLDNGSATLDSTIATTGAAVNSDTVTTDGSDTAADNASNNAGGSGDLFGGTGLVAMEVAPPVLSDSPPDGPVLSGGANSVDYALTGPPAPIDSHIGVTDTTSATLTSATLAITAGFFAGDKLNFTNQNGITGSYNAATGVLTLTGTASLANYQAALESITFTSANGNATNSGADDYRTISWTVTDSTGASSNTITSNVIVSLLDVVEGAFVVYDIRNNTVVSVQNLFQAGFAWTVAGFGDFSGNANETDMLLRNTATSGPNAGEWEVYDISKNTVYTALPLLVNFPGGPSTASQWTVVGFGDFSGNVTNNIAETDMLLRNSTTGALEVYDISQNAVTSTAAMGAVGMEWTVAGLGDFSTNPNETDLLLRSSNTGQFEFYDIVNNTITSVGSLGAVGLEWTVAGFGDFSGNANETDMMLRNSGTGEFEVYDISQNTITSAASMGAVGMEWTVAAFGDFSDNANQTDMLLRNDNTGAFELYDISNNQITGAVALGAIGLEWAVSGVGDLSSNVTGNVPEADLVMRDTLVETASLTAPVGPLGSSAAATAAFNVNGDLIPQFTGSLTLTDGSFSTTLAYTGNGNYTANLETWPNGTVSATLSVVDWYGNSFTTSTTVPIVPDFGATAGLSGPTGTLGSASATAVPFTVTTPDGGTDTGSLTLTDGTFHTTIAVTGNGTYTANLETWPNGTVSASLSVTDPAGNSFGATATAAIEPDFGATASVSGPTGTLGSASASMVPFVVTTPDGGTDTGSLTLTDGTFHTTIAVTGNGTYTENLSNWPNGPVSATLTVGDPAGNSFTASTTVAIDPDFGATASVSGPPGTLGSASATAVPFTVTTPDGGTDTGSLTLTDGTFHTTVAVTGNGTYTENLSNWPNGPVSATLTVSDPVGNSFTASTTVALATDFGETVGLSGPPGTLGSSAAAAAKFTVTGNLDANYSGSLTLTDGASSTALAYTGDGTYTANLETWPNGTVSASLAVTDPAGNSFSASATAALATDFSETVALSGPPGTLGSSAAAAAKFVVTGNLDANYSGSLTLTDGASSTALAYTGDGTYTANLETWPNGTVSASLAVTDPAGNSFGAAATAALATDFSETVGLSGPPGTLGSSAAAAAKFVVTGNLDANYAGSLTLTDGTFSTALAYAGDGTYTANLETWPNGTVSASLAVTDPAGNSFSATATAALATDFSETVGLSGPPGTLGSSAAAAAKFTVTGNLDANYSGSLTLTDGASSTALAYTGDGTYTANLETWPNGTVSASLAVTDPAGNSFSASATAAIATDFSETVALSGPPGTLGSSAAAAAKFVVTGNLDANYAGSLTLTDGASSTALAYVGDGTYTANLETWPNGTVSASLAVTDPAGNSFTASATASLVTDFSETVGLSGPPGTLGSSAAAAAKFVVTGNLDANYSGSLTLTDGASSTALAYTGDGTYTANLETWPNGTVSASLAVTDPAGNSFSATATAALATDFSETVGLSGPPGTLGSSAAAAAKFVVTGNLDANYAGSLTLTDGASTTALPYVGDGTYTANLETWPNGTVSASLAVSDPAGNSFSASATAAIATDLGETVGLSGPPGTLGSSAAAAAKFVVTGNLDANYSGSLTLTDGGSSTALAYTGDGTYTANLETWPNGMVSASLAVTDPAGNSFSATTTAALATDFSETVVLSGPPGTLGSSAAAAAKFVVTGNLDVNYSGSLTLTDGASSTALPYVGDGTYTANLETWPNGTVSASLAVTDPAGNSFTATATASLVTDFSETVGLSGPPGTLGSSAAAAAKFVVTGNLDANYSGSLTLTDGASSTAFAYVGDGTYTANLDTWPNGTVSASLAVTDPAGNSFGAAATAAIATDFSETVALSGPPGTLGSSAAAAAKFVVTGNLDANYSGSLTLTDGASSTALPYVGDGTYTANLETWPNGTVSASLAVTDPAGNSFSASATAAIATDLGETVGLSGPPGTLGSSAAAAAKFVVTGNLDANYSGSLTLTDGASTTALAYTGDGTYTANLETWPNGAVSASLAVTDPAGNSFSATTTAALQTDFSETVALSGPPGTLGSSAAAAAKFVVTGNLDVDYVGSLTLTDGASSTALPYVGDGTYTANLETWPNGTVSASLAVTDPAGNSFSATATASLVTDFSETVGLSGPPGTLGSSAAAAAKFVVTGNLDANYSGSLTLTDGASSTAFAYTGDGTYTANLDTWPNGVVNASLAVTDPAGNSFGASATAALQPDFSETVALSGPPGTLGSSAAAAAKFVVTGNLDANYAGSLTLTDGASSTALPYVGDGTYVANLETWPDGAVSVTLTVSDPVGNSFTASTTAAIDPDFGEAVTLTPASTLIGSSAAAAVKFVVTGNLDAADTIGSLTLTDGAMASAESFTGNGTYTFNLSANSWADGSVTSTLTVTDAAGNSFAAAGAPVTLDKETGETATLTVTNPNETVGHATVSFTIGGLEAIDNNLAGSTATVTFAEGGGNTITDTIAAPSLGHTYTQTLAFATFSTAGSVTASLTFTDAASNTLTATASPGVTLIPPAPQFGPTDGDGPPGNAIEGSVIDLETGTITLVVENLTSLTSQTLFVSETASNATISWLSTISYNQAGVGDSYSLQAYEQGGATVNQAGNGLAPAGAAGSPINLALTNLALTDPGGGEPVAVTIAGVPAGWSLNAGTNLGNGTWAVETSDPSSLAVTTPATFAGAVVLTVSESWTNPDGGTGSARIADNVEAYAPGNAIFALSGDDTLTGSGANDVFVFARPIGSDTIDNFNPASDRIDLVGFANVASFADIQASLADDANGNAVITLGNGETITITGVGSAALSAANFLLNQEPVTTNAGTMTIADGAMLPLGGTVDNSATIALASAGGGATLQVQASGVTLQGGGQVVLSDDGRNLVTAADPSAVLTNVDNTISGAGEIGAGQLTLDNRGVIDATGANALVIDTGGNVVANSGTLEATGSGGLMVAGAVANSGTLAADGGNLTVEGAVSGSGGAGAEISGGATLEFGAASSANVGFAAGAAGMLKLDQASGFSGTVAGLGAGDAIDLADIAFGGGDTLAYAANAAGTGGVLSVSDGTHAANLALLGQYAASEFATAPDPGGGTVVTYGQAPPPSGTTDQALLAHPPH